MNSPKVSRPLRRVAYALLGVALVAGAFYFGSRRTSPRIARVAPPSASQQTSADVEGEALVADQAKASATAAQSHDAPPSAAAVVPAHVFSTPMVAVGAAADKAAAPESDPGLAELMRTYVSLGGPDEIASARAIGAYLAKHPDSPWAVSLLQEQANIEWRHGYFTDAMGALHAAWDRGKKATDLNQKRLAEAALSELLTKSSALGRKMEVRELLAEVKGREVGGLLAEKLYRAKELLWFFENRAEDNIYCGFSAANEIAGQLDQPRIYPDVHGEQEKKDFIANGLSLYELRAHSREAKGDLRILKREKVDAPLPVPSIVHWKFGHYSSITEAHDGLYRVKDFHLKFDSWVDPEAIKQESSGYLLASASAPVPTGYAEVSDAEAKTVFGRHCVHGRDDEGIDPEIEMGGIDGTGGMSASAAGDSRLAATSTASSAGGFRERYNFAGSCLDSAYRRRSPMAQYSFRSLNPGLQVFDTPILYSPAYGPEVSVRLEYDQRSTVIPDLASHSNFGPRWTHELHGYVEERGLFMSSGEGLAVNSSLRVVVGTGDFFDYSFDSETEAYKTKFNERSKIVLEDWEWLDWEGNTELMTVRKKGDPSANSRLWLLKLSSGKVLPLRWQGEQLATGILGRPFKAERESINEGGSVIVNSTSGGGGDGGGSRLSSNSNPGLEANYVYFWEQGGEGRVFRRSVDEDGNLSENGKEITGQSEPDWPRFYPRLKRYRLLHGDGSSTEYSADVGEVRIPGIPLGGTGGTRLYLTAQVDSWGNPLRIEYDNDLRITRLVDAVGGVTEFSYAPAPGDGVPGDMRKVRSIIDPAGRQAKFRYDANGRLQSITDPVGIVSSFSYGSGDFLNKMTTPYGDTTFESGNLPGINEEPGRYVEATDPAGDKERAEGNDFAGPLDFLVADTDPLPPPPTVNVGGMDVPFFPKTANLQWRNTFYWDKWQMRLHPRDYSKATVYHWKAQNNVITGVLESMKRPLQSRVWYNYPGQNQAEVLGTGSAPSKTVQAVESVSGATTWRMERSEYHPVSGVLTRSFDALGRETVYEYAENGIDLLATKVKEAGSYRTLIAFSDYLNRKPQTMTDAGGMKTTFVYNDQGQITTVTNPKNETTTTTYYTADEAGKNRKGRIAAIDGPLPGGSDTTTFDYDNAGNVAKITNPDGFHLSMTYDAIGRLTRTTFPDGTSEEIGYTNLDATSSRDRLGRITTKVFNSIRQLVSHIDPANRVTSYIWCRCGGLRTLIDAMGRATNWEYDVQGRPIFKTYADGSKERMTYQPLSGLLAAVYREEGREQKFAYNLDGTLAKTSYSGSGSPTPDVRYTYDPFLARISSMTDGTGTTFYTYKPLTEGTLGAGKTGSVDGPLPDDTVTYGYDELGRGIERDVNGVPETSEFDEMGRLVRLVNPLGVFLYSYVGPTTRLQKLQYPNGMTANYEYHDMAGAFRLKDLHYKLADGTSVARFSYDYDASYAITRWTQRLPAANIARQWDLTYDKVRQLTGVTSRHPDTGELLVSGNRSYSYDKAGNRLTETVDGVTTTASYDALNQLVSLSGGNSSSLPDLAYEWDGERRLAAISYPGTGRRSEFSYDGLGRCTETTEKSGGQVTARKKLLWEGLSVLEERNAAGSAVQKRYCGAGVQTLDGGQLVPHFFATDHLGSVRSVVTGNTVAATVDYDPWGRRTATGADPSDLGFTGHRLHEASGLALAPYRAYAPWQGRWISRDPSAETGGDGPNLYAYTQNDPILLQDPTGGTSTCERVLSDGRRVNCIDDKYAQIEKLRRKNNEDRSRSERGLIRTIVAGVKRLFGRGFSSLGEFADPGNGVNFLYMLTYTGKNRDPYLMGKVCDGALASDPMCQQHNSNPGPSCTAK